MESVGDAEEDHPAEQQQDQFLGPGQRIVQRVAEDDGGADQRRDRAVQRGKEGILQPARPVVEPADQVEAGHAG